MQNQSFARQNGRRRVANRGRFGLKRVLLLTLLGGVAVAGLYTLMVAQMGTPAREWARARLVHFMANNGFQVENIYIEGRVHTEMDLLRNIVNLQRGEPIFAFDPETTRDLLRKVSWIKDVEVRRQLPNTIYINLYERTPMALWQHQGKVRVIDTDGVVVTTNLAPFRALPLIVGDGAPKQAYSFLSLLQAEPDLAKRFEAAVWTGNRRWDLMLRRGLVIKLPEENVGLALRKLGESQTHDNLLEKDIVGIDLREEDRFVIRTHPGAVQEYKASFTNAPAQGDDI